MIRFIYWLIKHRWAICKECRYQADDGHCCKKYLFKSKFDFVSGEILKGAARSCWVFNEDGCWGFKAKGGHIEPSEPWPRY